MLPYLTDFAQRALSLVGVKHKIISCQVNLMDGTTKGIPIDATSTVADVIFELYTRLHLRDQGFALCGVQPNKEVQLRDQGLDNLLLLTNGRLHL